MGTLFPLHSWHVIGLPSCSHQGMARGAPPRRGRQGSRERAAAAGKECAARVCTEEPVDEDLVSMHPGHEQCSTMPRQ